jgi:hypothetical protein
MTTTIASALLFCLPGLSTPHQPLRVEIKIEGAAPPSAFVTTAISEAADIWAAYGVRIWVPTASDAGDDGNVVRLVVKFTRPGERHMAPGALGSIVFDGDTPAPTIELYPTAASALIAAVAFNRRESAWPAGPEDKVQARVLGRALAHEIGHFLLRSKTHSRDGLMRAEHGGSDLMAPSHHGFALSPGDICTLHAILSASVEEQ